MKHKSINFISFLKKTFGLASFVSFAKTVPVLAYVALSSEQLNAYHVHMVADYGKYVIVAASKRNVPERNWLLTPKTCCLWRWKDPSA